MRHAGLEAPRTRIGESVWEDDPEDLTNLVDVHVSHLRRKIDLGDRPPWPHRHHAGPRGFRLGEPQE